MILSVTSSSTTKAFWYLTRATGLVSLVLLTLVMVLGILQVERWSAQRWPRFVVADLHRNASLLAVAFLGVHILTSVVDGYAPIGLVSVVVPFTSSYRPIWLGLGAVAVDLVLALTITSLLRQRIGHSAWRAIHWAAYACWPIAFVHGLGTGSDGRVGWVFYLNLVCLGAMVAALGWRLAAGWSQEPARRLAGALATTLAMVMILGWALTGPTQRGWARRAGTPSALLGHAGSSPPATTVYGSGSSGSASGSFRLPIAAALDGHLTQTGGGDHATVVIVATFGAGPDGTVRVELEGQALDNGGLQLSSGRVTLGPTAAPNRYSGPVTSLAGTSIVAHVTAIGGRTAVVQLDLRIDPASSSVGGTIDVR
jgi:Ferric reductase like transmembrane component